MWMAVLDDYLREYVYMGATSSLSFNVSKNIDGIQMHWSGYDDVIFKFAEGTLTRISDMTNYVKLESLFNSAKEIKM
jgi:hypothetical protein